MNMTGKIIIVAMVLVAVAGVVTMKQRQPDPSPTPTSPPTAVKSSPEEAIAKEPAPLPRLVDLGADKCIPCKTMAPILEQLREDFHGQFEVTFIDVWKDTSASEPYGIQLIPTQIFFDAEGKELFRHEGFFSREEILAKWYELGFDFQTPPDAETGS